jgi:hypothetical protein
MDETRVNWWMDAGSQWHRGFPPSGWWQAEDGRWHPPGDDEEPTGEMREIPQAGAAHLAADGWGWPRWARNAVLASVALIAIVVVATAAITDGGGDGATVTTDSSTTVTPSTVAAPSSVAGTSIGPAHNPRHHDHDRRTADVLTHDEPAPDGPGRAPGCALFARGCHRGLPRRRADDLHTAEMPRRAVRQRALAAHRLLTGRSRQRTGTPRCATPAGAPAMPSRRSFCHRSRVPASAVATDWMTTRYINWR